MGRPELNPVKAAKQYLSEESEGSGVFPWQMDELRLIRSNCKTSKEYAQEKGDNNLYWVSHYRSKKIYHLMRGVNVKTKNGDLEKAKEHFDKFLEFQEKERAYKEELKKEG